MKPISLVRDSKTTAAVISIKFGLGLLVVFIAGAAATAAEEPITVRLNTARDPGRLTRNGCFGQTRATDAMDEAPRLISRDYDKLGAGPPSAGYDIQTAKTLSQTRKERGSR